jgi:5-methylcytosine-specific restriction endonuclease McrA
MKPKKPNAERVWKQLEDQLVPRLPLSTTDRAVYSHLLRHSRLEGKKEFRFSIRGLARYVHVSDSRTRDAVRRLADRGALRIVERSKEGHVVEVRLPEEIPLGSGDGIEAREPKGLPSGVNLEEADFLQNKALRQTIHERERGHCFYCLRRSDGRIRCLDHVVPRAKAGRNCYRNLVSCCLECNSLKGECSAADFLRSLYRECRLTAAELNERLRALEALAAGKLPPHVQHVSPELRGASTPMGPAATAMRRRGRRPYSQTLNSSGE